MQCNFTWNFVLYLYYEIKKLSHKKMSRITICNSSGVDAKKLAHRLEMNVSQLMSEALSEYYKKYGRRYPEVLMTEK
jgi:hypothetical protein